MHFKLCILLTLGLMTCTIAAPVLQVAEDLDAALVVDSDVVHRHAFGWSANGQALERRHDWEDGFDSPLILPRGRKPSGKMSKGKKFRRPNRQFWLLSDW